MASGSLKNTPTQIFEAARILDVFDLRDTIDAICILDGIALALAFPEWAAAIAARYHEEIGGGETPPEYAAFVEKLPMSEEA